MKKVLFVLSTVLMLTLLVVGMSLSASGEVVGGNCGAYDETTGEYGDNVTWSFDTDMGALTISGEGEMNIRHWRESHEDQIVSVVIEEGVTSIDDWAFYDCDKLTSIKLPASVTSIGSEAFYCPNLKDVYITDVAAWLNISFGDYSAHPNAYGTLHILDAEGRQVTDLVIPDTVTTIRDYAFYNCDSLMSVTFGENSQLTSIGNKAFYGCSSLTSITIPSSVTSIGSYAFYNCDSLMSVTFGENSQLTSIGNEAFYGCNNLMSVTIPASVTSIGNSAFSSCGSLMSVTFGENSQLMSIQDFAFYDCGALTSIEIPASVTSIGSYAFCNCDSLMSVTFGENSQLTSIGANAFANCCDLTNLVIPNSVTTIGEGAFCNCSSFSAIVLPEKLQIVEKDLLRFCHNLKTVYIPTTVRILKASAFESTSLETIIYCGTEAEWNAIAKVTNWDGGNSYTISYHDMDCTPDGEDTHTSACRYCDYVDSSAPHAWDDGVTTTEPTHLSEGEKVYTCTDCGAEKTEVLEKDPAHSYGDWEEYDDDQHKKECECGEDTLYEDHAWDDGVTTTEPTHMSEGEKLYTCTACGAEKTEVLEKDPAHSYGDWEEYDDDQHKKECECGKEPVYAAHAWDSGVITTQPTHTKTGLKTFTCTGCGHTKTEVVAKTSLHTYGKWTSYDGDQHKKTCACGESVYSSHTWNDGVITQQPTHTQNGVKTLTCTGCGYTKNQRLPKTEVHEWTYIRVSDAQHKVTCACGSVTPVYENHTFDSGVITTPATHTHTGLATVTCTECGYQQTKVLNKLEKHEFSYTYDSTGHTATCACGEIVEEEHDFIILSGGIPFRCSKCGYSPSESNEESGTASSDNTSSTAPSDNMASTAPTVTQTPTTENKTGETTDSQGLIDSVKDRLGCQSVVSIGASLSLILSIGAAGVLFKKKED